MHFSVFFKLKVIPKNMVKESFSVESFNRIVFLQIANISGALPWLLDQTENRRTTNNIR